MLNAASNELSFGVRHEFYVSYSADETVKELPREKHFVAFGPVNHRDHLVELPCNAKEQADFTVVGNFYVRDYGDIRHNKLS